MTSLARCVISEGICESHRRFRRTAAEFEPVAFCPSCKRGGPIEMRQVGTGLTRKKMPFFEATDKIFNKFSNTVQMPNTTTRLPEGM